MVEFLVGRACTGKTQKVLDGVCSTSLRKRVILIVPEQFTFESEREIIKRKNAETSNIVVTSFTRLFNEVLDASLLGSLPIVSEFEKIIILKKALKACSDSLTVLSRASTYHDFPMSISDTIRDFKFAGIEPEELSEVAERIGGSCGAKLKDISLIWSTYDSMLGNKFIDSSDILTKTYELLCDNKFFENCDVFLDSFTGFTGQQYKIIDKIIEQADNITFAFCTDEPEDRNLSVFHNINNTIVKLKGKSIAHNTQFNFLDKNYYVSPEISHLESVISGKKVETVKCETKAVRVISCENPREETIAAANIISKCVSEDNYRFKDFILVARKAENYFEYVERQCRNYDIAYFCDRKISVKSTLLCMYLMSLLEVVRSCSSDNILKIFKMGLYDVNVYDIADLENYIFIWDLKGKDWFSPWKMSVRGLTDDPATEEDNAKLAKINTTREKIVDIIDDFKKNFNGSPKKRATAIFDHITKYGINKRLSSICNFLEKENDTFGASETKQSWDVIVNILDSVVRTSDDNEVSSEEFVELFSTACDFANISNTPQMLDEVTFGSADRIRPSKPKIAIILGANQGVFPQCAGNSGLLGFSDKQKIKDCGIDIDDNVIKSTVEENYLVYSMLCCATDKVYVLYSRNAMSGDKLEASSFVAKIHEAFDDLKTDEFKLSANGEFIPRTPKAAFSEIGIIKGNDFVSVKESLADHPVYFDKLNKSLNDIDYSISIGNSLVKELFGEKIKIFPTNFEEFHKCKATYFFRRGLNLKKLQKSDLNQLQRGTIAHYVFENIIKKHGSDLAKLTPDEINEQVDELIHQYFLSIQGSEILVSERFAYLIEKIASAVKRIVLHMAEEFAQSDFEPKYCELKIGKGGDIPRIEYVLSDGSIAYLEGKIDRVDVYDNNVRVVDYKTGSLKFTLSDTLVGLNMQMLLYLYAVVKNGSELIDNPQPAGILYKNATYSNDPKSLKMSGLISNDENIRTAMEKDNKGKFVPKYISNSTTYVDRDIFDRIFEQIDEFIVDMGEEVLTGEFSPNPIDIEDSDACKYCNFASICRFSNQKHRTAEKCSHSKAIEILKGGN